MSRSSSAKNTTKTPWRIDASTHGIIDFVETPSLHTPIDNVVGGPPAYLESHGIRYVPEAAAAALSADGSPLAPLEAEHAPHYTRQDLNARVDTRVSQFMRESSQDHGLAAPGRLPEDPGQATEHRLRALQQQLDPTTRGGPKLRSEARGAGRKPGYDY